MRVSYCSQGGNSLHRGFGDPEEHRPASWFWKKVPRQDGVQKTDQVIEEEKLMFRFSLYF